MPKLPDVSALGARPNVDTQTPVVKQTGGQLDRVTAQTYGQDAAAATELAQVGQNFEKAQSAIRTRQSAVDAAMKETAFTTAADAEFNRLTTEADVADEKTLKGYGSFLTDTLQKTLGAHTGTPESQAALGARLEGIKSTYAMKMGQKSFEAGQARVSSLIGQDINGYVAAASEDPSKLPDLFKSLDSRIATLGPALTPDKELELMTAGRRQMVLAGVNKFIESGDVDHAQQLLDSTPGVTRLLTPDDQAKLRSSFATVYAARNKGAMEAKTKLDVFRGINGRDPNAQERLELSGISSGGGGGQTNVAKALGDLDMFERTYGKNSPQAQAMRNYITKETTSSTDGNTLGAESAFRSQYANESKAFVTVRDAFGRIAASADAATAAGDLSLIYNFARMLDPNGAVREQDFQQVAATGGLGAQIQGYMQQLSGTGRLSPAVRADLLNQSKNLMQSSLKSQISLEGQYKKIAARSGFNQDNVLDLVGDYRNVLDTKAPPGPQVGAVIDGYKFKGGDPAQPESWEEIKAPAEKGGTL